DRGLRDAVRAGTWKDPIDLWPLWRAITCPILLVRGAESDVLSPDITKRMLETNPNVRFEEVAGGGPAARGRAAPRRARVRCAVRWRRGGGGAPPARFGCWGGVS